MSDISANDPITFAVLKSAVESIVDDMAYTVMRTARSPIVRDVLDYSTTMCDAKGRILAQAKTVALHLGAVPDAMEAIQRHYREGAPTDWAASFISEYATMHPWEDFAETFAHYLHITGTLATAAAAGVILSVDRVQGIINHDVVPEGDYSTLGIDRMLDDWHWLSLMFNRVNRSMGQGDLYPFTLTEPVIAKLRFVHELVAT